MRVLAYCGIDCSACPAYRGTMAGDLSLLEEAACKYSDGASPAADWVCMGCPPADQAFLAKACTGCTMRRCAIARGLSNCAVCDDFEDCTALHGFIDSREDVLRRMNLLRQRFLASCSEKA